MKLLLVGGGNMGAALLTGWQNNLPDIAVTVIEPYPSDRLKEICNADNLYETASAVSGTFDIITLAIKPQSFAEVLPQLKHLLAEGGVVLSIAAGKTLQSIADIFGKDKAVIRVMPNTPALIGQGMSVLVANDKTTKAQQDIADKLLSAVGKALWVHDENDIHAVTALSGSGPAYVFAMIEAMQKAGIALGLSEETSLQLARQTMLGSAMLAEEQSATAPSELRRQVTSPGGTTEAALKIMLDKEDGLDDVIKRGMIAAATRSQELS